MVPSPSRVNVVERRLIWAALVIGCAMTSVTVLGGLSSWNYYLTVEECQDGGPALLGRRVRVSGVVAPASLRIRDNGHLAEFAMIGRGEGLAVTCRGPLPDNLRESVQVVVEGRLERGGRLRGERLMTRCAGKYEATASTAHAEPSPGVGGILR